MALISNNFLTELRGFSDQKYSAFTNFPSSKEDAVDKWVNAFHNYASLVTPPSTTGLLAKEAMFAFMSVAIQSESQTLLEDSFQKYVLILATGMIPTFTGVAPIEPLSFSPVYSIGLGGGSNYDCLSLLVTLTDTWMRTGIAINVSSGATLNWN